MNIQMKATELYISACGTVHYAVQGSSNRLWMKCLSGNHSNETHERYFPVVLSILLCKMVLTFESVDKIPVSQHSGSWIFGDIKR